MSLPTVASLWIGGRLSFLEQVCLKSFVDHGHTTVLYTYGKVTGVPRGVEIRDANAVFPNQNFIRHKRSGSPAIHADAFRYRMIEVEDVIWIDADILCMQPWDFSDPFVFGWEKPGKLVCNAVLGLPPDSATLKGLNDLCRDEYPIPPWASGEELDRLQAAKAAGDPVHVSELSWGVWGPAALTHFLVETGEMAHVLPQNAFFPIPFKHRRDLLNPSVDIDAQLGEGCYGVHLWNRRLRRRIVTHENNQPHPDSFFGQALIRHGVDPLKSPIPDEPPGKVSDAPKSKPIPFASPSAQGASPKALADMAIAPNPQGPIAARNSAQVEARTDRHLGWLPDPAEPIPGDKITVVTGMKNEAPFILEWIAYHRAIGVTDFLVYTNDCSDNTNEILDRLQHLGVLTRKDNPWKKGSKQKPQHAALKDAVNHPLVTGADWVLTIDVDEFVNIHVGDGTFADFFAAANHPNVISFTWKFFGNGGVQDFEDKPVTEQFLRCAPEVIPKPRLGWGFKTMFHKSAPFLALGVHRPTKPIDENIDAVRWVNGSGKVMPPSIHKRGWRSTTESLGYKLATLNHYVLRSADSYLVKRERGRINHTDQDQGLYYWSRRNYATETDDRMLARQSILVEERDRLLKDKTLAKLHRKAVDWHRGRVAQLKADPAYLSLYDELIRSGRPDALFVKKEDADGEAVAKGDAFDPPAPPPCDKAQLTSTDPRFANLEDAALGTGGFYWESARHAVAFVPGNSTLIVSFESERDAKSSSERMPYDYETSNGALGCSVLGVMAKERNWYRDGFVQDAFDHLRDQAFFKAFSKVLFLGASMGGYAALAYSTAAPGSNVLAFSPQATLDRSLVPDDNRWGWTAKLDWSGRYANFDPEACGSTFVLFDPTEPADRLHAQMLKGPNTLHLAAPFLGHGIQKTFGQAGIMPELVAAAATGTLTEQQFHRLKRARMNVPRYQAGLIRWAADRGRMRLAVSATNAALERKKSRKISILRDELAQSAGPGARQAAE